MLKDSSRMVASSCIIAFLLLVLTQVHVMALSSSLGLRQIKLCSVRQYKSCHQLSMVKKSDVRPSLDDVERISKGQAAKKRGTGSRGVPHRLNEAERKEWDLAKKRRFLLLRGSGWRKERGDSPLANIYRQFCDCMDVPCVTVSRGIGNPPVDEVIIDFSPLRKKDVASIAKDCITEAAALPSFLSSSDNSNVDLLGWDNAEQMLEEEVIWRIPVFSIVSTFTERADSRQFAEVIAQRYANGIVVKEVKEAMLNVLDEEEIEAVKGEE